ncbi:hypothetical protein [Crenobacter intestini]|uniref:Uncharacterized protein n=1 Tax=Crenobacter intestini TaxID=2563443 RepID=A0A4T0UP37_9NEIS|nr:hypothetical protein [Crenobacter intestini]TIC80291.1 hypothetical protein E5K04_12350 [Crenobacter intestini]
MTAQFPEKLRYKGKQLKLFSTPLSDFFHPDDGLPRFGLGNCSALWRNYVGHWAIIGDRLYLTQLDGTLEDGNPATLATFFPDFPKRVFAHWYSGTLCIPQGKPIEYIRAGFGGLYEQELLTEIERGVVTGTRIQHNETAGLLGQQTDAPPAAGLSRWWRRQS